MTPEQIQAVEDEFVARLQAGGNPNPDEVVLDHPEVADEIRARLYAAVALRRRRASRLSKEGTSA